MCTDEKEKKKHRTRETSDVGSTLAAVVKVRSPRRTSESRETFSPQKRDRRNYSVGEISCISFTQRLSVKLSNSRRDRTLFAA